jgi:FtsP/CotA-like multicopper oxidase with cupredoxin domain
MRRREFIGYGMMGAAAGATMPMSSAEGATVPIALSIEPADVEMIDGTSVFMLIFYATLNGVRTPRPVLRARQGDTINLSVTNNSAITCGFSLRGVSASSISSIAPGQTRTVTFTAPRSGSYLYLDPTNAPVNRLVGLHGAFIVGPANGTTVLGAPCPYSRTAQTAEVREVFDTLGKPGGRFPGRTWKPNDAERDKVWLFSQVDPVWNNALAAGLSFSASAYPFVPRYFTINGFSGIDSSHDHNTQIKGYVGQPTMIRVINGGWATHSAHIHGNHVLMVGGSNANGVFSCYNNIHEVDVWAVGAMACRDVLLPFERPPDIPDAKWPPTQEPFPLRYPFHCHCEMSNTAGGGNYPQGLVTHWEILGPTPP